MALDMRTEHLQSQQSALWMALVLDGSINRQCTR